MSSKKYKDCLLTSYFTLKKHPQCMDVNNKVLGIDSNGYVVNDSFEYIEGFYESVKALDLEVIIFHDDLSIEFIELYSRDNVSFIKVPSSVYSNNDYRFMCYLDWANLNKYDRVFMTDIADVLVNPSLSNLNTGDEVFFCRDSILLNDYGFNSIGYFQFHHYFNWENLDQIKNSKYELLNMGVIGSSYDNAIRFLDLFCTERIKCGNPELNLNMSLGNYIARNFFSDVRCGSPYCSDFKEYQLDRKDVYFIHK